jgi:hypothetical protein
MNVFCQCTDDVYDMLVVCYNMLVVCYLEVIKFLICVPHFLECPTVGTRNPNFY